MNGIRLNYIWTVSILDRGLRIWSKIWSLVNWTVSAVFVDIRRWGGFFSIVYQSKHLFLRMQILVSFPMKSFEISMVFLTSSSNNWLGQMLQGFLDLGFYEQWVEHWQIGFHYTQYSSVIEAANCRLNINRKKLWNVPPDFHLHLQTAL